MGVDILAPARHIVLEFRYAVDHRHAMSPLLIAQHSKRAGNWIEFRA
jgi:hypothetical protein